MKREYPVIDMMRTGQIIKKTMIFRGLTVKDVQSFLGLATPQGIYHWFDGRSLPTLDNIYAFSELFHVPVDAMLCGNRKYTPDLYMNTISSHLYIYFERLSPLQAGC